MSLATPPPSRLVKPLYINAAGDPSFGAMTATPPFIFRNVTARIFSLNANMAVLKTFCNQYLNMDIPPSIVHYAPAMPYVYMTVLNYGSMSSSSVEAQNLGWVSQREVTFSVLLQRWREENGSLVFQDWATVSPFIYVDDPTSLANGRESYGWNKVLATIDSAVPLWISDPRAKLRQFDLSVVDFESTYTGQSNQSQTLLQVDLDPPPTFTEFPPDPRNPWSPIWSIPNAISGAASLMGSSLDIAASLRLRGYEANRSMAALKAMAAKAAEKLRSAVPPMLRADGGADEALRIDQTLAGLPTLFVDAVTLKQFRNPEDPSLACYQAIVDSKMGVDRVNRAGLLGDVNLLRGDLSGGYSIRIHKLDSQPIIQTLGLEVDSWSEGDGSTPGAVATLKPVLPSWLDVDLYYGSAKAICSRAHGGALSPAGSWLNEETNQVVPSNSNFPLSLPFYNNALGAATQPITGPFHFPDTTLQVYPLLADRDKLRSVLDSYLNSELREMTGPDGSPLKQGWRFEPFGSYVYMVVTVYGEELGSMWSGSNNIGDFFDREVGFCIPVKWYDETGTLVTTALIEPFTFSNDSRAVATDREVNGFNTVKATIESPQDVWLDPAGPIAPRRYLQLDVEVIPALNLGQKAVTRPLIEIDERPILRDDDTVGWSDVAAVWGRNLIDDLKRRSYMAATRVDAVCGGKALALEILANGAPLNRIILKQYRDGDDATRACYQSLVHATSAITSIYDLREIDQNVHVRIHRQPGNLIVNALGLRVKRQESHDGEVVDILQAIHPFWARVGLREDLATVACYRSQAGPWQVVHPWFHASLEEAAAAHGEFLAGDTPTAAPRAGVGVRKPYFGRSGPTPVGDWLVKAPPAAPPPRPTGDSLALFANAADVQTWLDHRTEGEVEGANMHLGLRRTQEEWLRRAIVNELAWIRVNVDPALKALGPKFADDPDVTGFLACPLEPNAMMRFAEQYSVGAMDALLAKLSTTLLADGACPSVPPLSDLSDAEKISLFAPLMTNDFVKIFQRNLGAIADAFRTFFQQSTEGIRQKGLAWAWDGFFAGLITDDIFGAALTHFDRLSEERRLAFLMTMPKAAYPLLLESKAYIESPQYRFNTTFDDYETLDFSKLHDVRDAITRAGLLADLLERGLLDWLNPSRWRRMTYQQAAARIEALDDVQLVIDAILSAEWENRSPDARWLTPKAGPKPDETMLIEPPLQAAAAAHGLERWVDPLTGLATDLWMVPSPGLSDPIKGGRAEG